MREWRKQFEDWEADNTLEDPYQVVDLGEFLSYHLARRIPHALSRALGPTQAQVRREMAEEDSRASAVTGYVAQHDVTLSGFVTMGLDIEEEQYIF